VYEGKKRSWILESVVLWRPTILTVGNVPGARGTPQGRPVPQHGITWK
jgi:hypothetical protein